MLCCFAFTASAGSMFCCIGGSDNTDTQQIPLNDTGKNCQTEKDKSTDDPFNVCCQDMSSCHTSLLFISFSTFDNLQKIKQSDELPQNKHFVFNSFPPPTPPPKLIN